MNEINDWLTSYPKTTQATYARVLANFMARSGAAVLTATQSDVARYHAAIAGLAPGTVATRLAVLASFYKYLERRGIRHDNPMVAIAHRPKVDKQGSVKWLEEDEQRALLNDEALAPRNKAMLWVLLHGLRLAELLSLDVEDYRNGELRFTGKGGKSRIVPLVVPAQNALAEYLGRRRSGPLFSGPHGRISRRQVQRIVSEATERNGQRMHPHALRHSFATRHVKAGTGLPQLQKLMGHKALSSTQLYVHLNTDDVRQAMTNDPLAEPQELRLVEVGKVTVAG